MSVGRASFAHVSRAANECAEATDTCKHSRVWHIPGYLGNASQNVGDYVLVKHKPMEPLECSMLIGIHDMRRGVLSSPICGQVGLFGIAVTLTIAMIGLPPEDAWLQPWFIRISVATFIASLLCFSWPLWKSWFKWNVADFSGERQSSVFKIRAPAYASTESPTPAHFPEIEILSLKECDHIPRVTAVQGDTKVPPDKLQMWVYGELLFRYFLFSLEGAKEESNFHRGRIQSSLIHFCPGCQILSITAATARARIATIVMLFAF